MRGRDRALCLFYGLFTIGGFLAMTSLIVAYVLKHREDGPYGVLEDFLRDAMTNAASRLIYADLTLVWIALAGFMVVEARRLGIRYVWAYIIGAPLLALCVSFTLFMFIRQLKIAYAAKGAPNPSARLSAESREKGSDDH